jgi:hypothetical protein
MTTVLPIPRTTQQGCPYAHVAADHPVEPGRGTTTLAAQPGEQQANIFTAQRVAKSMPDSAGPRGGPQRLERAANAGSAGDPVPGAPDRFDPRRDLPGAKGRPFRNRSDARHELRLRAVSRGGSRGRAPVVGRPRVCEARSAGRGCDVGRRRRLRVWRLPTEVEWQHAMSAGRGDEDPPSPWGTPVPPPGEIPEGPLAGPWPTGRGTPTAWGIFDPGTVVHEWCADWFEPSPGAPVAAAAAASSVAATRRRASRGGSWRHQVRWSRPSARSSLPPEYRYSDYGFRLVVVADDVKAR